MKIICFWSGGKDAAMMLHELLDSDDEVVALATTYDESSRRVPFQSLDLSGLRRQAEALGLELIEIPLPPSATNDVYRERVLATLAEQDRDADAVAFGDMHLSDVRRWRKQMFEETAYRPLFPLWGRSTRKQARRFLSLGFEAVVTCVDTRVLALDFLGRPFDQNFLDDIPDDVDPCGENGEFHTVVWDGPLFEHPLQGSLGELLAEGPFVSFETSLQAPVD